MEDSYSDDVKTTTVYSNTLSTATSKWSPGFETMFNHWSDLQKYEVQWQDHNDRRGEAEASNNCTENMGKGVWTNAIKHMK